MLTAAEPATIRSESALLLCGEDDQGERPLATAYLYILATNSSAQQHNN
jgi:hypothetical protein